MFYYLFLCLLAYLIGSIPTSYWLVKLIYKRDIRKIGSGNSGASNTFRNFGLITGLAVLSIDIFKGYVSTRLDPNIEIQFFLILSAILGHVFSIFSDFKGGKGVAISLGCLIALNPQLVILPVIIFLITLLIWRIASVSSLVATFSLLISSILFNNIIIIPFLSIFILIIILFAHRENVERIINGEEKKLF